MSLRYDANTASTFVLIQGCDDKDYKTLDEWLEIMKESAGHPLLTVALFLELHYRRLRQVYDNLKRRYIEQYEEAFSQGTVLSSVHRDRIEEALNLHETLLSAESELTALRSRLSRLLKSINFVQKYASADMKVYTKSHGSTMTDRLLVLSNQIDFLHQKCTNVRQSVSTLISAMWNLVAIAESKISQQISVASKRDSTVMIAIAIGTMLFLPLTAMASIFAMPFLPWNSQGGDEVARRPLLIYLCLSLPLTGLTLFLLVMWIWAVDFKAETSHLTIRPAVKARLAKIVNRFALSTKFKSPNHTVIASPLGKPSKTGGVTQLGPNTQQSPIRQAGPAAQRSLTNLQKAAPEPGVEGQSASTTQASTSILPARDRIVGQQDCQPQVSDTNQTKTAPTTSKIPAVSQSTAAPPSKWGLRRFFKRRGRSSQGSISQKV